MLIWTRMNFIRIVFTLSSPSPMAAATRVVKTMREESFIRNCYKQNRSTNSHNLMHDTEITRIRNYCEIFHCNDDDLMVHYKSLFHSILSSGEKINGLKEKIPKRQHRKCGLSLWRCEAFELSIKFIKTNRLEKKKATVPTVKQIHRCDILHVSLVKHCDFFLFIFLSFHTVKFDCMCWFLFHV